MRQIDRREPTGIPLSLIGLSHFLVEIRSELDSQSLRLELRETVRNQ